jgi:hypothetical protein
MYIAMYFYFTLIRMYKKKQLANNLGTVMLPVADTFCADLGKLVSSPLSVDMKKRRVGDSATYSCQKGHRLKKNHPRFVICENDGQWSNTAIPECESKS